MLVGPVLLFGAPIFIQGPLAYGRTSRQLPISPSSDSDSDILYLWERWLCARQGRRGEERYASTWRSAALGDVNRSSRCSFSFGFIWFISIFVVSYCSFLYSLTFLSTNRFSIYPLPPTSLASILRAEMAYLHIFSSLSHMVTISWRFFFVESLFTFAFSFCAGNWSSSS